MDHSIQLRAELRQPVAADIPRPEAPRVQDLVDRWHPKRDSWLDRLVYRDEREWLDREPDGPQARRVMADLERFNRQYGINRICRELVTRFLPRDQDIRILDVGCGSGVHARELLHLDSPRQTVHVTGVDLAPGHLRHLRWNTAGLSRCQADACRLPFADRTFAVGISIQALHHFTPALAASVALEMRRTCRVSILYDLRRTWYGALFSPLAWLTNSRAFAQDATRSHRRAYTVEEMRDLFASLGIAARIERCRPIHLAVIMDGA